VQTGDAASLTIPNDMAYLEAAKAFGVQVAAGLGFGAGECNEIELAIEEAAGNVIRHAFEPGERASFDISFQIVLHGLKITVHDMGIPFAPQQLPAFDAGRFLDDPCRHGLGMRLMETAMDGLSFHNLGPAGKEVRMVKYLGHQEVTRLVAAEELAPYPDLEAPSPVSAPVPYTLRLMQPEDTLEIARCAYKAYRYTYINPQIYYPERIAELNGNGELISVVAVTENGDIMGHTALEVSPQQPGLVEMGVAFVKPEYRGQGCVKKMGLFLVDLARQRGFGCVFVQSIVAHTISQKAAGGLGFRDCALRAGYMTDMDFRRISGKGGQRLSLVVACKPLQSMSERPLYVPERHHEMVRRVYESWGIAPELGQATRADTALDAGPGQIETVVHSAFSAGDIKVHRFGTDTVAEIGRLLRYLCLRRLDAISLSLPLIHPATCPVSEASEAMGFFFCGVLVDPHQGDRLLLQYLNNVTIDYDRLQIFSETGQALRDYIRTLDPNCSS
jgi:anti-sigma regulatory factor (Ser/Thr protein kinase)/RimJ/RimL family protein N-acetyltransferase